MVIAYVVYELLFHLFIGLLWGYFGQYFVCSSFSLDGSKDQPPGSSEKNLLPSFFIPPDRLIFKFQSIFFRVFLSEQFSSCGYGKKL